ncbi:MAG: hypothetical protein ACLSUW_04185 [Akkermansia sp.]
MEHGSLDKKWSSSLPIPRRTPQTGIPGRSLFTPRTAQCHDDPQFQRRSPGAGPRYGGFVPRFAQLMNAKARQMGMYNSRFANPTASRQINIPLPLTWPLPYACATGTAQYYQTPICLYRANGRTLLLRNTNKLLTQNPWVTGMKTGHERRRTRLVSSAGVNGRHIIVVVGCHPSVSGRNRKT